MGRMSSRIHSTRRTIINEEDEMENENGVTTDGAALEGWTFLIKRTLQSTVMHFHHRMGKLGILVHAGEKEE